MLGLRLFYKQALGQLMEKGNSWKWEGQIHQWPLRPVAHCIRIAALIPEATRLPSWLPPLGEAFQG